MLIICPSCTARYHVEAGSANLPTSGRNLRCGRCGNSWQAMPIDPPAEILPPAPYHPQPEPVENLPKPEIRQVQQAKLVIDAGDRQKPEKATEEDASPATRAARRSAEAVSPATSTMGPARAFGLGILLAMVAAGLHYRTDVVKAVPSSARLFAMIGLPVNLHGLEFRSVQSRRSFDDGLPVLVVEGEIVNLREMPSEVPALRISVRGEAGQALYAWRVEPRQRTLEANGTMSVRSRLAAPPSGAVDVELRFDPRRASSGTAGRP